MRIFAAFALTAGLMLTSAGAALATAEPEQTQTPTEDVDDASPAPSPTATETAPEETEATEVEDDEVEDDEVDDNAVEDELEEGGTDGGDEQAQAVEVDCTNVTIETGQRTAINCSPTPAGATLSLGAPYSQIGGTITLEDNQLQYQAPNDASGTDTFTVIASAPDYEDGTTQLTVTVTPPSGATDSPSPTLRAETHPPSPSPEVTDSGPPTEAATPEVESSPPHEPTSSATLPMPPSTPDAQETGDVVLLPVPGMPSLPELAMPGVNQTSEAEAAPETSDDHRYDSLAATGSSATFGAVGLGALTLALGAGMLVTSRRVR